MQRVSPAELRTVNIQNPPGKKTKRSIIILGYSGLLFFILVSSAYCQSHDSAFYFYHGKPYGSEAIFNPLTVILNGGFGILQISNRSNSINDIDFRTGMKNVTYNLSHPFGAISNFGWKNFIRCEVIPTSVEPKNAQFYPNYQLHLIGGGFTYRAFLEWYRWHGYPKPTLCALSSWFSYHFLCEVVENNSYVGPNVDPIADMYIFNPLGLLLFSSDRVTRFFGHTLHMRDWSFMPGYDPRLRTVENVGQNFAIKIKLPYLKSWSSFSHWGIHGMTGLSYQRPDSSSFSAAGGLWAKDLIEVDNANGTRWLTTSLVWTLGFFYDRNNSLMASLILSGTKGNKARVNIYPGLINIGMVSPGFFVNLRKDNQISAGVHLSFLPVSMAHRIH
jgi:hypothetical protein